MSILRHDSPAYAGKIAYSDMSGTDADGKPQRGFKDRARANMRKDPKAPYQMPLTKEEQDILNGSKGPELAKIMKIVVAHGNAFGAERLVDLGGRPHCSLLRSPTKASAIEPKCFSASAKRAVVM